ncbi:MarR family winged helix-turn-helix transcriptional regulator, partial [Microbacterium ulmi]
WARGGPHAGHHHGGPHQGPPEGFPWTGGAHGGRGDWGMGGPRGRRMGGPALGRMLEALASASGPLSVGEVAEAVGVDQPRASRLVQQAVDLGLARREADPDDARRTRIVLTDDGAAHVRRFHGDRRATLASALEGFTDDERAELARLLAKLADAWRRD